MEIVENTSVGRPQFNDQVIDQNNHLNQPAPEMQAVIQQQIIPSYLQGSDKVIAIMQNAEKNKTGIDQLKDNKLINEYIISQYINIDKQKQRHFDYLMKRHYEDFEDTLKYYRDCLYNLTQSTSCATWDLHYTRAVYITFLCLTCFKSDNKVSKLLVEERMKVYIPEGIDDNVFNDALNAKKLKMKVQNREYQRKHGIKRRGKNKEWSKLQKDLINRQKKQLAELMKKIKHNLKKSSTSRTVSKIIDNGFVKDEFNCIDSFTNIENEDALSLNQIFPKEYQITTDLESIADKIQNHHENTIKIQNQYCKILK